LKNYYSLLLLVSFLNSLSASLMMTPKEVRAINSLSADHDTEQHKEWLHFDDLSIDSDLKNIQTVNAIYLGAILYFSPSNWTVWINDQTFTSESKEDQLLRILKVSNHVAEIEIKNASFSSVKLRPSQTLIDGRIVNGDAREKQASNNPQL
jgi:hypothetical protein